MTIKFTRLVEAVIQEKRGNGKTSQAGAGVTFVDIDETLFKTFAKVVVMKGGKKVREVDNQEFNSYVLKDGETYDFGQFKDAKLFARTSIAIPETIGRLQKMITQIRVKGLKSKVIFLTARADFDDKDALLQVFRDHGLDIDWKSNVYIERTGNDTSGTIPERKRKVMLKYLATGEFRRCRLIDDHKPNVMELKNIKDNMPEKTVDKIRLKFNVPEEEDVVEFYGLHIDSKGKLKRLI